MRWYYQVLRKFASIQGRARRKEYWYFCLLNLMFTFILVWLDETFGSEYFFSKAYCLIVLIPSFAVVFRRLHDTGRSGWYLLVAFLPLVGSLIFFFFMIQDGDPGDNQYGPNPKESS